MNLIIWIMRFLIPLVVLFTIGYYVPGFSALTITWLLILSALIVLGDRLVHLLIGKNGSRLGRGVITFLISAVIIFFVSYGIQGGHVPLGAALFTALIIAVLSNLVNFSELKIT